MKAVKANKEYTVTEENRASYVAQGFDILDDKGKVIQNGKGKTVDYGEYEKLKAAHEKLMEAHEKLRADYEALSAENEKLKAENRSIERPDTEGKGKASKKAGE